MVAGKTLKNLVNALTRKDDDADIFDEFTNDKPRITEMKKGSSKKKGKKEEPEKSLLSSIDKYSSHVVFLGFYQRSGRILCIHENKKVVKNYLRSYRGLNNDEYRIEPKEITDEEIFVHHDDACISDFMGHLIPNIDIEMIQVMGPDRNSYEKLKNIVEELKNLLIITEGTDILAREARSSLIAAMKTINNMAIDDKICEAIYKEDIITNSILYEPIDEYLTALKKYEDYKYNTDRFKNIITEENRPEQFSLLD